MSEVAVFSEHQLHEIARSTVLANTPASLFRWLERYHAVVDAAKQEEDCLLDVLSNALRGPRNESNVAAAYACVVAIIIRRRSRPEGLGEMPFATGALAWGHLFWELAKGSAIGTKTFAPMARPSLHFGGGPGNSAVFPQPERPALVDQHGLRLTKAGSNGY